MPYASFCLAALVLSSIGQTAKALVGMPKTKWRVLFYKTIRLHPVIGGALVGLVPGLPVFDGFDSPSGRVLYFAGAGVFSTWVYGLAKQYAAKRGYRLPGSSFPPPGMR